MEEKIPKIFILDDDPQVISLLSEILLRGMKCDVLTFETYKELINYKYLDNADLFIVDVMLKGVTGFSVLDGLHDKGVFSPPPILFISGYSELIDFNELKKREFKGIFDYMMKPLHSDAFLNRVQLLLKVSKYQKEQAIIQDSYNNALWDMMYYSNFYFLVLNCGLEIKKMNEKLAEVLGVDKDISGKSILEYTTDEYKTIVPTICDSLIGNKNKYMEFVFDVTSSIGKRISVKWFITFVNEGHNFLLCIGIPFLEKENTNENIDTLRHYYKTMVDKDTAMIRALKKKLGVPPTNYMSKCNCVKTALIPQGA